MEREPPKQSAEPKLITFLPVSLTQVLAETTAGQSIFYVPGLAQYGVTGWQYFGQDRLGSVRTLIDPTGELLLARNYDPFGNVLAQGGVGQSVFGYTGEQVDSTGLVYLRARYYAPSVGRFLTPDSIVPNPLSSQGWNRYTYVENNPVRYTDPSGHCGPLRTTLDGTVDALDIICQGAGGGSGITGEMIGKATAGATTITVGIGLETGVLEFPTMPPGVFSQDTTYPVGNICSEPGLLSGAPPVDMGIFESVPFPSGGPIGPITIDPPQPVDPDLIPNIVIANSGWFKEIYYNGRSISRRTSQPARDPMVIEDLTFEYPEINPWEWKKVEQIFEYDGERYDLHWFEARGIVERGKVD